MPRGRAVDVGRNRANSMWQWTSHVAGDELCCLQFGGWRRCNHPLQSLGRRRESLHRSCAITQALICDSSRSELIATDSLVD
jgi:hypothetical protein